MYYTKVSHSALIDKVYKIIRNDKLINWLKIIYVAEHGMLTITMFSRIKLLFILVCLKDLYRTVVILNLFKRYYLQHICPIVAILQTIALFALLFPIKGISSGLTEPYTQSRSGVVCSRWI